MEEMYLTEEKVSSDEGVVVIRIEVDRQHYRESDALRTLGQGGGLTGKALSEGMALIRACTEQVAETINKGAASARPNTVEVEFGNKLNGEVRALIAKTRMDSHLKDKRVWNK